MMIWNPHLLVTNQANFVEALSPEIDVHSAWPSLLSQTKFSQAPKLSMHTAHATQLTDPYSTRLGRGKAPRCDTPAPSTARPWT
jgi:hypothetical protein